MHLFQVLHTLGLPPCRGILQVGASSGQELPAFVNHGVALGIFIEPLPEPFARLTERCRQIPNYVPVQALCTSQAGATYTFHLASNEGMSSSILPPANHITQFDFVKFEGTMQLVSIRLDDILASLRADGHGAFCDQLDTLYMDTQGAELEVLKGGVETLKGLRYIFTEVTRNELYRGAPTLLDLMSFLEPLGFTLNNANFDRHHHTDATFIRRSLLGMQ